MAAPVLHPGLWSLSRLFSYPDAKTISAPLPPGLAPEAEALLNTMKEMDPIRLENEYIRLFVNALPEVPCAPYGSVYLEGTLMGTSTMKVAEIYRQYGITPKELADHIAVESEFLAWLHERAMTDAGARKDFASLLGHFRQWTALFFEQVVGHDQLGCYRRSAEIAHDCLEKLGTMRGQQQPTTTTEDLPPPA